jgi:hypothetical protein
MTAETNMTPHSCNSAAQPLEVLMALSSSFAGIVAKFSTLAGGSWVEQAQTPYGTTRVWRFDERGNSEWADLADLQGSNPAPRWFGHQFKAQDFILC